jgi:hypothetical protein
MAAQFARVLNGWGETVQLYAIVQTVETVTYGAPQDIKAVVSPLRSEEVILEPGYLVNDYLVFYTAVEVKHHDKIILQGSDFELQSVVSFKLQGEQVYFKSVGRRLIAT